MGGDELFEVLVIYALPDCQRLARVRVTPGTTVATAIRYSGVLQGGRATEISTAKVGIWGRRVDLMTTVKAGDRIEVYRPLSSDPVTKRRHRTKGFLGN